MLTEHPYTIQTVSQSLLCVFLAVRSHNSIRTLTKNSTELAIEALQVVLRKLEGFCRATNSPCSNITKLYYQAVAGITCTVRQNALHAVFKVSEKASVLPGRSLLQVQVQCCAQNHIISRLITEGTKSKLGPRAVSM